MTRKELEQTRQQLTDANSETRKTVEAVLNDVESGRTYRHRAEEVGILQKKELLNLFTGILNELQYMNDKEGEVNNG